jgi:hypothetical protein
VGGGSGVAVSRATQSKRERKVKNLLSVVRGSAVLKF